MSGILLDFFYKAGVPGFEPGNAGIKTPCLTAWRHPNQVEHYLFFFSGLSMPGCVKSIYLARGKGFDCREAMVK